MEDTVEDIFQPGTVIREPSCNWRNALRNLASKILNLYIYLNTNVIFAIVILILIVGVTVSLVVISVLLYPVHIDFSLRAFEVPNHIASRRHDSFIAAKDDFRQIYSGRKQQTRVKREQNTILLRTQQIKKWKLDVVYVADDGNVFTAENLKAIHEIEGKLLRDEHFHNFCWRSFIANEDPLLREKFNGCTPPNSLVRYFFRTNFYDGLGKNLSDISGTLDYLLSLPSTFWYVDETFSRKNRQSRLLRTQLYFGVPLRGFEYDKELATMEAQHKIFKSFIVQFVDNLKGASSRNVRVLYGSPEIYDYQVMNTFKNDLMLAISSFVLIFCLVFLLSSFSLWLTFCGIISIILSVPLAYFFYRVCLNMKTVGILTGASIFVIIGIGVDDVFVFINVFKQYLHLKDHKTVMRNTIKTAGKATFFTSFTTAAAFGANALSQIPAVHDFGLYSCIVVMACWLIVMLGMPPSLTLWVRFFRKCESAVYGCLLFRKCRNVRHGYSNEQLLPSEDIDFDMSTIGIDDDNSDVVMNGISDSILDSISDSISAESGTNCNRVETEDLHPCVSLSSMLQRCLRQWVARPVIKARYVTVAVYVILICLSVFLATRLNTAKDRPELFSPNSNLQRLLNLRYNLSAEDFDCTSCSGMINKMIAPPKSRSSHTHKISKENRNVPRRMLTHREIHRQLKHIQTTVPNLKTSGTPPSTLGENLTSYLPAIEEKNRLTTPETNEINEIEPMKRELHALFTTHSPQSRTYKAESVSSKKDPTIRTSAQPSTEQQLPEKLCPTPSSCKPAVRPILDKTALVYIVFGVKGIDRSSVSREHVLSAKGRPIYDEEFVINGHDLTSAASGKMIAALCKICNVVQANKDLVQPGGGDCFPGGLYSILIERTPYPECKKLKTPKYVEGRGSLSVLNFQNSEVRSVAMAFESTTPRGKAAFKTLDDYKKWEAFMAKILADPDISSVPGLQSGFQTSSTWVKMFSEITAVNGALYGIVTSIILCFGAAIIFTGNAALTGVICMTIIGILLVVLSLFYLAGWELGAVEAVSLSILVGTSVDYTVHLVEGYILSGKEMDFTDMKNKEIRALRTQSAVSHIGVSILSSALTTLTASIPLCFTQIQLFSKFGQILAMNTGVSLLYTITVCVALLSTVAPSRYSGSIKARTVAAVVTVVIAGVSVLILYLMSKFGHISIPGPSGGPLFH